MTGARNSLRDHFLDALLGDETDGRTYRIGDLAKEFGLTLRALRFYEDKGLLKPERRQITRLFSGNDRRRLRLALLWMRFGFALSETIRLIELVEDPERSGDRRAAILELLDGQLPVLVEQQRETERAIADMRSVLVLLRQPIADTRRRRATENN